MGDRTSVTLHLLGSITRDDFAALTAKIEAIQPDDFGDPDIGVWGWHECMPDDTPAPDIHEAIREAGLRYAVEWDAYPGSYTAGIRFIDPPHKARCREWGYDGAGVLVRIDQARNPNLLDAAARDQADLANGLFVGECRAGVIENEIVLAPYRAAYTYAGDVSGHAQNLPDHMLPGLLRYLLLGVQPGEFLSALLQLDVIRAARKADEFNRVMLAVWLTVLDEIMPREAWGDTERFAAWVKRGGLLGEAV